LGCTAAWEDECASPDPDTFCASIGNGFLRIALVALLLHHRIKFEVRLCLVAALVATSLTFVGAA
jgi:hypothetical protein